MKISGLREVEKQLIALGDKRGMRVLRRAMLKAADPILTQAQANLAARARGSGALHRALGKRFHVKGRTVGSMFEPSLGGRFAVEIGPRRSERVAVALYNLFYHRRVSRIFHGHFIEFGFTTRSGKRVAAEPFLKPALDSQGQHAVTTFAEWLRKGIAQLLKEKK